MSEVYFLRPVGMQGPVKIGWSKDVAKRLASYNLASPFRLEIAARVAGTKQLEMALHERFFALHSHHEWFHPSPEIDEMIDSINDGDFDPSRYPFRRRVIGQNRYGQSGRPA